MNDTLKVLELAEGVAGPLCGRMFANFGAEVLKAELGPEGDWTRDRAPMVNINGDRVGALFHFLNAGKRSIALGRDSNGWSHLLNAAWSWADVVLVDETFLAIKDVELQLSSDGPRVVTCITPFGRTGPRSGDLATSATIFALSGESSLTPGGLGYELFPDAPPLVARGMVPEIDAGVVACLVSIACLTEEHDFSDHPIVNDISIHEVGVSHNRWLITNFERLEWIESRASNAYSYGGLLPCADGYVMFMAPADRHWAGLVKMMEKPEWGTDEALSTYTGRRDNAERIRVGIVEWAATRTRDELMEYGLRYGVPIGPYRDVEEVVTSPQLADRGFFVPYGPDGRWKIPGPGPLHREGINPAVLTLAPNVDADSGFFD